MFYLHLKSTQSHFWCFTVWTQIFLTSVFLSINNRAAIFISIPFIVTQPITKRERNLMHFSVYSASFRLIWLKMCLGCISQRKKTDLLAYWLWHFETRGKDTAVIRRGALFCPSLFWIIWSQVQNRDKSVNSRCLKYEPQQASWS